MGGEKSWGVKCDYGFAAVRVTRVTAKTFSYIEFGNRESRADLSKLVGGKLDEADARLLVDRLTSARAEMWKRERQAREWFQHEKQRYLDAAIARAA